jgi:hypothetical protein
MLPVSLVCPFLIALRFSLTFILAVVDAIRRYLKKIFTATLAQFMLNVITIISFDKSYPFIIIAVFCGYDLVINAVLSNGKELKQKMKYNNSFNFFA